METISKFRIYLLTALVLGGFGVLVNRLHEFQIERRYEFLNRVPGNQSVTIREPGIRGIITDRSGVPLARNRRQYEVSFNLAEIQQAYLAEHRAQKKSTAGKSATKEKEKDIVAIVNETTIAQLRKLDLARNYNASALRTHFLTHGGLVPFRYRTDLSFEEFSKLAEHNIELPGVYLALRPQREYPLGTLASHALGYLKQWEKGDIEKNDERRFTHYIGSEKGIAGALQGQAERSFSCDGYVAYGKHQIGCWIWNQSKGSHG